MINSNNALGFAIRNKVNGLEMLKQDRQAVNGMFSIDREDSGNDGFELLAKRLANTAILVFAAIQKDFKGKEKPLIIEGIQVKHVREGKKEDIAWLKTTENAFMQVNGKELNNRPTSFKKALHEKKKEEAKVLDIEFNEQLTFPKLKKLTNNKFLVEKEAGKGQIFSDFLAAMEHFVSLGGKVNVVKGAE